MENILNTSNSYKAFTIALLVKKRRCNGMIYANEKLSNFHKKLRLKVSYNTFQKYWHILEKTGCIQMQGKHQQLLNWEKCAELLNIVQIEKKHLNTLLNSRNISSMTFNEAGDWLLEVIGVFHFRAQYHKLKPKRNLIDVAHYLLSGPRNSDRNYDTGLKKLAKVASQNGMDTFNYARRLLRDNDAYIKTGSYYFGNLLGISQRKANRLLNDMVERGLIKRQIVKISHEVTRCDAGFDFLKNELKGKLFFPTKKHGFVQVLGSKIELPEANGTLSVFFQGFGESKANTNPITMYKPILKTIKYQHGK